MGRADALGNKNGLDPNTIGSSRSVRVVLVGVLVTVQFP
jgi:hypothetical protein